MLCAIYDIADGSIVFRRTIQQMGLELILDSYKSREYKKQPPELHVPVLAIALLGNYHFGATGNM